MKKVTFIKAHIDHKAGDTIEVTDERANYFERVGVAKEYVEEKKAEQPKPAPQAPAQPAAKPAQPSAATVAPKPATPPAPPEKKA